MDEIDRRRFLRAGVAAGTGALLGCGSDTGAAGARSRLVVAKSEKVFAKDRRALDQGGTQKLVDAAVARLVGETDATAAWKKLVKPDDTVGIKVNCLAGERLSSRIEVVRAIASGVRRAGVPAKRIVVFDRKRHDLVRAHYPLDDRSEFVCVGNDHPTYGFRGPIIEKGVIGSLFSQLVTRYCSVIINVPVFKDHDLSGISVALKSFFGTIHNPNKYHFGNLHQAIADVNRVHSVRRKTILHLCDATFGCCHTGPTPRPKWRQPLGTLYVSPDPVAVDYSVWQRIEAMRKAKGLPSLVGSRREPKHVALAADAGLGTNDPAKIELVEVEV